MKILFFDIDGTLIDVGKGIKDIPVNAKKKMKELQRDGNLLFLASGRPYGFVAKELSDFGFDGYVLCNGAHVEINNKIIFHEPTNEKKTFDLIKYLDDNNFEYIIETKRNNYLNSNFKVLNKFFLGCNINTDYLVNDFDLDQIIKECLKLEANIPIDNQEELEEIIKKDFKYDKHGTDNAFEIYSKVISKATGIKKVLEYLNLDVSDSYGFGDGLNDIEMIETVGVGVAMDNGVEALKEVSDIVCDSIGNDGLYKILNELF